MSSYGNKKRRRKSSSPVRKIQKYIRKERRKEQLRKERYSPAKYSAYLKKKRKHQMMLGAIFLAVLLLLILILIGIGRLIGAIFGGNSQTGSAGTGTTTITKEKNNDSQDDTEQKSNTVTKDTATDTASQSSTASAHTEEKDIWIGSTGSMFLHDAVLDSVKQADGTYDFSECFQFISPYFSGVDYMTCEFEGSLAGEENGYCGYPLFNAPDSIVPAIADAGIDLVNLASNHVYDWLTEGFRRMMTVFDEYGVTYSGIRESTDIPRYRVEDIDGILVGFVDYVFEDENEEAGTHVLNENWISDENLPLINTFSYADMDSFYSEMADNIAGMKADGAQFIIANMHWGEEYSLEPTVTQQEIAQKLADLGINAVIGGHPHVEEPVDVIQAADGSYMFIVYAQGNLLCNQRKELIDDMPDGHTEDGLMTELKLHQDSQGNVTLAGVQLVPLWCDKYTDSDGNTHFYILPLDDVDNIEKTTGLKGILDDAKASYDRTMALQGDGLANAQSIFGDGN